MLCFSLSYLYLKVLVWRGCGAMRSIWNCFSFLFGASFNETSIMVSIKAFLLLWAAERRPNYQTAQWANWANEYGEYRVSFRLTLFQINFVVFQVVSFYYSDQFRLLKSVEYLWLQTFVFVGKHLPNIYYTKSHSRRYGDCWNAEWQSET